MPVSILLRATKGSPLNEGEMDANLTALKNAIDALAGGAALDAQYLTLATSATLTDERVFTLGTGLSAVDAGAGSTYTLSIDDEAIQDMIATFLVAGTNVSLSYNDAGNALTVNVTGLASTDLSDFAEAVDDRVAALLVAGTNVSLSYNDVGNALTVNVTGLASTDLSDFSEAVDDRVAALLTAGTNVTLTYNDVAGTLTIDSTGGFASPMTTLGDIIYGSTAGAAARLAGSISATKMFLTQTGTGAVSAAPAWGALAAADYPTMIGDSGAGGTKGAVPAPAAGDAAALKFLKADGTWAVPAGGGSGTPGGSTNQIQYNAAGAFAAEAGFEYDPSTNQATIPGLTVTEDFGLTGDISPAQITADQNDYAPTGNATATVWRINSDASRTITGISGGADGRVLIIANVGSFNIVLGNQNAGSTAGNRIVMASGVDLTITPNGMVTLLYDSTTSRWRCMDQSGLGTLTIPTKVQCLTDILAADTTTTTTMSSETPTVTQGKEIATVTITPTRVGSKIVVRGYARTLIASTGNSVAALFKDGASTRVAHSSCTAVSGYYAGSNVILYTLTTASLTPITFALRAGSAQAGTCNIYAGSGIEVEEWDSAASFTLVPSSVTVAPNDAQYLTLAASANLTNERVLTFGGQFTTTDGGAGGTYTVKYTTVDRVAKTANYTATSSEFGSVIEVTSASATTQTLLTAVGNTGKRITYVNAGAGALAMATTSSQTIGGLAAANWVLQQGQSLTVYSDGTNWLVTSAHRAVLGTFTLTSGATVNTDAAQATSFLLVLGTNVTLANPTNLRAGVGYVWRLKQDGTGSRTCAYGTAFLFPGGVDPVLSTAANTEDILSCWSDGTNLYCNLLKAFA